MTKTVEEQENFISEELAKLDSNNVNAERYYSFIAVCKFVNKILDSVSSSKDKEIEELKAKVDRLDKENEWISVNEKLPYKDDNSGISCLAFDNYHKQITVKEFNEYHKCWDDEDGDDYYSDAIGGKITHWKPLPSPPNK